MIFYVFEILKRTAIILNWFTIFNKKIVKKRNIRVRTLVDEYVCKMWRRYLEKESWVLPFWIKNPLFRYFREYGYFSSFRILSNLSLVKGVLRSFLRSCRKSDLSTCITPPKHKILNLTFFDLGIGWPWSNRSPKT